MRNIIYTRVSVAGCGIEFKGKIKKRWCVKTAAVALFSLAACDPVPKAGTACVNALACQYASGVAKNYRMIIGSDFDGRGFIVRNARANGETVQLDMTVPPGKVASGSEAFSAFAKRYLTQFCSSGIEVGFFEYQAQIQLRGFTKDGKAVGERIIRSCRGVT